MRSIANFIIDFIFILLFMFLARFYNHNLNSLIANSLGISFILKRAFWNIF